MPKGTFNRNPVTAKVSVVGSAHPTAKAVNKHPMIIRGGKMYSLVSKKVADGETTSANTEPLTGWRKDAAARKRLRAEATE